MLYDYICPSCNTIKEVEHSMKESPIIKCNCGTIMKIRIGKISGIHFKGKDFTKTSR